MNPEEILAEMAMEELVKRMKKDPSRFDILEYENKLKFIVILAGSEKHPELLNELSDRLIAEKGITYLEDLMTLLENTYK